MSEYSKSFIIRFYRNKANMTQEELAEGICSPVTLAKYEKGMLNPSFENFEKIMNKLQKNTDTVLFQVQTQNLHFAVIREDLLNLFETRDYDTAQKRICQLKSDNILPDFYRENRQFVERIEYTILREKGEISLSQYVQQMEKLLRLSWAEYSAAPFVGKPIYTETELLILNNIATVYGKMGSCEIAKNIFSKVLFASEESVWDSYKPIYLLLVNYSNLLGLNGYYDESIQVCQQGIQWLKQNNKANYLYNLYYNIGWNLFEKYKLDKTQLEFRELAKIYVWESYQLGELFSEAKDNMEYIRELYEKIG